MAFHSKLTVVKPLGWIVPTHPPRREELSVLIESFDRYAINVDLIIVWSRKSDDTVIVNPKVKSIYLEEHFSATDIELFEKTKSIINVKKLFGLMHEFESYQGLICTDDELEFIRLFEGADLFDKLSSSKVFPATDVSGVKSKENILQRVLIESCKILPLQNDRNYIKEATKDFSLFSWFSDIPFYPCSDIPGFLNKFGLTNYDSLRHLNFFTFDHILFQYYKVLNDGFKYQALDWSYETKGVYNWFECFHLEPMKYEYITFYQENFAPKWASSPELTKYFTEAICLFHTDRVNLRFSRFLMIKHHLKLLITTVFPKLKILE